MQSKEVVVGTQTSINVTMAVDTIGLEEVVAVGYGTKRKSDITSAISVVNYTIYKTILKNGRICMLIKALKNKKPK